MAQLVARGVNSFKFFFGYKGALAVSDELFLKGLLRCKQLGALPMVPTLCSLISSPAPSAGQNDGGCISLPEKPGHLRPLFLDGSRTPLVSWRLGIFCSGPLGPGPGRPHKGLSCGGHPCDATFTPTGVPFSIFIIIVPGWRVGGAQDMMVQTMPSEQHFEIRVLGHQPPDSRAACSRQVWDA